MLKNKLRNKNGEGSSLKKRYGENEECCFAIENIVYSEVATTWLQSQWKAALSILVNAPFAFLAEDKSWWSVNRWCKKRCGVIAKKNTANKKTFIVFFMVERNFIFDTLLQIYALFLSKKKTFNNGGTTA